MTYVAMIDAPRWYARPLLAWIARRLGMARKWEARGKTLDELDTAFRRLASTKGMIIAGGPITGYTLLSLRGRATISVVVQVLR